MYTRYYYFEREVKFFMDADGNIQGLIYRALEKTTEGNGTSSGIAFLVLLFVLFVVGGGYFGGAESAFSAMNKIRIKSKADNGDKKAKDAMFVANNFEKALTTLLIGNNITHIAAASVPSISITFQFHARYLAAVSSDVTSLVAVEKLFF